MLTKRNKEMEEKIEQLANKITKRFHVNLSPDDETYFDGLYQFVRDELHEIVSQNERIVIPKIAGTNYKPETEFRICEDGTFNLVYNLKKNKTRRVNQPEMINDVTISLSNNHHLTKEQMKEIAETICSALNSNFSE